MKRVAVSCTKPPLPFPPRRARSTIKSHITVVATATATSAVTGIPDFACATESVITPVIVPGLGYTPVIQEIPTGPGPSCSVGRFEVHPGPDYWPDGAADIFDTGMEYQQRPGC